MAFCRFLQRTPESAEREILHLWIVQELGNLINGGYFVQMVFVLTYYSLHIFQWQSNEMNFRYARAM